MNFDKEIDKLNEIIRNGKFKTVLIQLPDGFKPYAKDIKSKITEDVDVFFYLGTNFGACDLPNLNFDLIVNFGHSEFFNRSQINDVQSHQRFH